MESHVEFDEELEEISASPCLSGPPVPPSSTKHTPRKFSKEELSWKLRNSNARGWCETHRKQFMGLGQLDSDVQKTISVSQRLPSAAAKCDTMIGGTYQPAMSFHRPRTTTGVLWQRVLPTCRSCRTVACLQAAAR